MLHNDLEKLIAELREQIGTQNKRINTAVTLRRGEFETTGEWQTRQANTNKERIIKIRRDIADLETKVANLTNQV